MSPTRPRSPPRCGPSPAGRQRHCATRLDAFSAIVDARSESEYALDRLPGAVNWPIAERRRARLGRHRVQAGLAVRGEEARRGAGRTQHRGAHRAPCARAAARLVAARLLLARRPAQRLARRWCWRRSAFGSTCSKAATRRSAAPSSPRSRRCPRTLSLRRRLRHHRLGQEPAAARARRARRAGARPRGAGQPPRLGARPGARRDAAVAEGLRHRASGMRCAASIRRGRCSSRARAPRSATCACRRR